MDIKQYAEPRMIELALQWLGEMTTNQLDMERCRASIHGMLMAAIVHGYDRAIDRITEIENAADRLWIHECHLIPKAGFER